ncbi:MAG: amidohydrolase family protein [Treponema sp.]|jgi:imidazolonepropionase-like amidohydrolase|nr:amidohydrolase family protein [Treponema sp.]
MTPERLVLHKGSVLPMDSDRVLGNTDVLIEGGRITAVQPGRPAGDYGDARLVDCRGRFIMPALTDMHVHLFNDEFLDYLLSWGVTTVLNMWGFPKILRWRDEVRAGKRLGPDIYSTGPIIDSLPTYPLISLARTREEARRAVLETKAAGYDFVKIYNNLSPEVYEEIAKTAAGAGIEVIGHLPNCVNADYTGEARGDYPLRQKTIEHALFLNEYNIDPAIKAGVWLDPTFVVEAAFRDEGYALPPEVLAELRPLIVKFYWRIVGGQHKQPVEGRQKTVRKGIDYMGARFKDFAARGGKLLIGTDSGFPRVVPGYSMHQELAYIVAQGLSPYEALHRATAGAAGFLGRNGDAGTVAAGKSAELLVLDKNPLEDIRNTLSIHALVKREQFLSAQDLAAIRRRARRRSEFQVHTVFRPYMFKLPFIMLFKGLFPKKS